MKTPNEFFTYEETTPTVENLSAILSCLGARTSVADAEYILERQNPFQQKRGGLGFGAYATMSPNTLQKPKPTFCNINIYNQQAKESPLGLVITDEDLGRFLLFDTTDMIVGEGAIMAIPQWGREKIATGKPAITVLQQHGPVNLVGVLGSTRCELFDEKKACSFCMMNGGEGNVDRSVGEILEAFTLARKEKKAYNLTLTTSLQTGQNARSRLKLLRAIDTLKMSMNENALALEVAPFARDEKEFMRELKDSGLDTLMIPLDCATPETQQMYMPGKAQLLQKSYWNNAEAAVDTFGRGNATSSIIIGLEPLEESLKAIERMLELGVIPEPIPVRWDDSKLTKEKRLPLTSPRDLMAARDAIRAYLQTAERRGIIQKTRAGCAACGGCSGIVVNKL